MFASSVISITACDVQISYGLTGQSIEKKIPVSKSALYSYYGVPEPKDEDDSFVMPNGSEVMLSDSGKPKDIKKNFRFS